MLPDSRKRGQRPLNPFRMIRIAITEKAYAALVASVDEKPKGKPQANPSGELYVFLDQTTVARLEEIAEIYAGDMSKTFLRLAEFRDPGGVSMLQELMSDVDDLNDPPEWKRMVQYAEERERNFRAFVARCLSNATWLYESASTPRWTWTRSSIRPW